MVNEDAIQERLCGINDPELGFSIVELGLVYDISCDEHARSVKILMTLTSPGCPLQDHFRKNIMSQIMLLEQDIRVDVSFTFDPLWGPDRITKDVREQLALTGMPIHP